MFKKAKGFTLIELLIVVAIIGILAALLIPNALTALQKAKQKGTMKDIATISTALTDYVTDNSVSPTYSGAIDASFVPYLSPFYIKVCPINDQWGTPFEVYSGQDPGTAVRGCTFSGLDDFLVLSFARGGVTDGIDFDQTNPEAAMYTVTTIGDFQNDLIMWDGNWVRAPQTRGK
jgi:type II secretion system protein G